MTEVFPEKSVRLLTADQKHLLRRALSRCRNHRKANEIIRELTGLAEFLSDHKDWENFHQSIIANAPETLGDSIQEYGDFQTPLSLANTVCRKVFSEGYRPTVLIEPTCGRGNFILAALQNFPSIREIYGLEFQQNYVIECKSRLLAQLLNKTDSKPEIHIQQGNIFEFDFPANDFGNEQVLILGNPPWVTNTTLSGINSSNLPVKSNFKKHNGLDAITGKSNFDICEFILLQLIRTFDSANASIAMLCKNIVVRNLLEATRTQTLPIKNIRAFTFDAAKEFNVACDASLFLADIGGNSGDAICRVENLDKHSASKPRSFGWVGDNFVSDVDGYVQNNHLDGISPLVWRQGLKHDCGDVMELDRELKNGKGELVHVERDRIFPLAKSSDLKLPIICNYRKSVIVTQNFVGEDTTKLARTNPLLWKYLTSHAGQFAARKSSIYKGKPPFSIFGIGDYSFKPYKVALSGLYKISQFSLLLPVDGKPAMLDDTCYLLGFDSLEPALICLALLNSTIVQNFLKSISFSDSKRPYTKDILMRIDLRKAATLVSRTEISEYLKQIKAPISEFEETEFAFLEPPSPREEQALLLMEIQKG